METETEEEGLKFQPLRVIESISRKFQPLRVIESTIDEDDGGYNLRVRFKPEKKPKTSTKEKKRKYYLACREALKSNKTAYEEFKKKDAKRVREYRLKLTPRRLKRSNELAKIRQKRYRERKKLENISKLNSEKPQTRAIKQKALEAREKRREQWRIYKRKKLQLMTEEEKEKHKEKRRKYYHDVISPKICKKTSCRKKLKFTGTANIVTQRAVNVANFLRKDKTRAGFAKYRNFIHKFAKQNKKNKDLRELFNIDIEFWKSSSELDTDDLNDLPRAGKLPDKVKSDIQDFFLENSRMLPLRSTVKSGIQKSLLEKSLSRLHRDYQMSGNAIVSFSRFAKERPKQCLTVSREKFNTCLCEQCVNINECLKCLRPYATKSCLIPKDKYEVNALSLCDKGDNIFHNDECIRRKCTNCGTKKILEYLEPIIKNDKAVVHLRKWVNGKSKGAANLQTNKVLQEQKLSLKNCIEELCSQMHGFSQHLFQSQWQRHNFKILKHSLPERWLIYTADFAENYRCVHQDEPQAAHYNYNQVTIHPIVMNYKCPTCTTALVEDSIVFISPDLKHDAAAVYHYVSILEKYINSRGLNVEKIIQYSDCCAAQYRSKAPFYYLSSKPSGRENAYFGPRHGKSQCDALGGVVKKSAENFVKQRRGSITNALEFFQFCQNEMVIDSTDPLDPCIHNRRLFYYIEKVERIANMPSLRTLPKTRQMLCVVSQGKPGIINARQYSCFCNGCLTNSPCLTTQFNGTNEWVEHILFSSQESECVERKTIIKETHKTSKGKNKNKIVKKIKVDTSKKQNEKKALKKTKADASKKQNKKKAVKKTKAGTSKKNMKILRRSNLSMPPNYTMYESIKKQLAKFQCLDYMRADGNCYFRAVSKFVHGKESFHKDLRKIVVDFMKENIKYFKQYIDGDVDEHLEAMYQINEWATSAEIFATASLLQRDIYVFSPHTNRYRWLKFGKNEELSGIYEGESCSCYISICHTGGNHYDRICNESGSCNCQNPLPVLEHTNTEENMILRMSVPLSHKRCTKSARPIPVVVSCQLLKTG